jgi:adenylate kinase
MKKEHLGFSIVLLGMIASGKDTQAKILENKYYLKLVESGIYWRKLLKEKSKNGDWLRRTTGKGHPAPVALMKRFLVENISSRPKGKDLLFLGNPRLKPEAQLLKKLFTNRKENFMALYITLPEKEIFKRSLKRKNSNVKQDYKIFDNKKNIITRIKWHKDQVGKTVKYFESLGLLKRINGNQTIEKVHQDIEKTLLYFKTLNNK